MKISAITAFCFAACTTQPTAPPPEPTSSASTPPVASSAEPLAPAPVASASASAEPSSSAVPFEPLSPDEWRATLPGRWIGAEKGDAIPGGPLGGTIIDGGARVVFVRSRHGSKTPWNVTFWLPRSGHTESTTISGGCGFYPTGTAFCKGYGSKEKKAVRTEIKFSVSGDHSRLRMQVSLGDDVADAELVRAK